MTIPHQMLPLTGSPIAVSVEHLVIRWRQRPVQYIHCLTFDTLESAASYMRPFVLSYNQL